MIKDWGKINSNLKQLIEAYENPYFDLLTFCNNNNNNLVYKDIIGFINIGKQIKLGKIDLVPELKSQLISNEILVKQLEIMTL